MAAAAGDAIEASRIVAQRQAIFAGSWYPAREGSCRDEMKSYLSRRAPLAKPQGRTVAAVAPHAGWTFSGPTMAMAIDALRANCQPDVETVVCFGSVHVAAVRFPALWPEGTWDTPLGAMGVDVPLAHALLQASDQSVVSDPTAHAREHSIEVLLPFIRAAFPEAKLIAIAVPPGEESLKLGSMVAKVAADLGRKVVAVASTDLSHYGLSRFGWAPAGGGPAGLRWVRQQNDPPILEAMTAMDAEAVLRLRAERRNSCGSGAIAAAITFAKQQGGKRGLVIDYSSSLDAVLPGTSKEDFVTYAGVVFETD